MGNAIAPARSAFQFGFVPNESEYFSHKQSGPFVNRVLHLTLTFRRHLLLPWDGDCNSTVRGFDFQPLYR
jgi:hypothetical protein